MDVPKKYAMHLPQQLYLITVGTILKIETDILFSSRSWESIHAYHVSFQQKVHYAKGTTKQIETEYRVLAGFMIGYF